MSNLTRKKKDTSAHEKELIGAKRKLKNKKLVNYACIVPLEIPMLRLLDRVLRLLLLWTKKRRGLIDRGTH